MDWAVLLRSARGALVKRGCHTSVSAPMPLCLDPCSGVGACVPLSIRQSGASILTYIYII